MSQDFPAAHSMDTAWFAIDADGYVAVFCSGETGLVPEDSGYLPDGVLDGDEGEEVRCIIHIGLDGECVAATASTDQLLTLCQHAETQDTFCGVCVLVDDAALDRLINVKEVLATNNLLVRFSGVRAIYYIEGCYVSDAYAAFQRAELLAIDIPNVPSWNLAFETDVLRFYRYDAEYGGRALYQRRVVPARPTHIREFSEEVAAGLGRCAFSQYRFSDSENVYPAIYKRCRDYDIDELKVWFGVDADGHVALFSADDGRYIETKWLESSRCNRISLAHILEAMPRNAAGISWLDLDGEVVAEWAAAGKLLRQQSPSLPDRRLAAVYVLSDDQVIHSFNIHPRSALIRFSGGRAVYFIEECSLHEAYATSQCRDLLSAREVDAETILLEVLGFYHYSSATHEDNGYQIKRRPLQALHVSSLPGRIAEILLQRQFSCIRFSEADNICVAEHLMGDLIK